MRLFPLLALALAAAPALAQQNATVVRVDVTRWILSHGRYDGLRAGGIATPENPRGQAVPGLSTGVAQGQAPPAGQAPTILTVIGQQPNPRRVTLDLDEDGRAPRDPNQPSPLVVAGATIPSGFTLVVAELGANAANPAVGVRWQALTTRFGSGNLYATVSIPAAGILRGQELVTTEQLDAYDANSVLYEAPDIGNVIVDANIEGGRSTVSARGVALGADGAPVPNQPRQRAASRTLGWANPMECELSEVRQAVGEDGTVRVWVRAALPNSFEPTPWFRVAVEANSGTLIFDTQANPFVFELPVRRERRPYQQPDRMVKVTAVASGLGFGINAGPSPFVTPLGTPGQQSVGLATWRSRRCTLGDTLTIQVKPKKETRVARSICVLLDASGSMKKDGKMAKAKAAAANVLKTLGDDTEVALIVFYDCGRIRVEAPFTTDKGQVLAILPRIKPAGGTPLAAATTLAKDYMRRNASGEKLDLIILSDGMETCGGDPIKAASR